MKVFHILKLHLILEISRFKIAYMEPDSAFSIYLPLLWTKDIAVNKSKDSEANKAVYSPN